MSVKFVAFVLFAVFFIPFLSVRRLRLKEEIGNLLDWFLAIPRAPILYSLNGFNCWDFRIHKRPNCIYSRRYVVWPYRKVKFLKNFRNLKKFPRFKPPQIVTCDGNVRYVYLRVWDILFIFPSRIVWKRKSRRLTNFMLPGHGNWN